MAKQRKKPPPDNELRWLTTYGDVVTLLLAFFVMLYAISQVDQQKFQLFVTGLADPFGNPAVSDGLLTDGTGIVGAATLEETVGENSIEGLAILDGLPSLEDQTAEEESPESPAGANDAPSVGGGPETLDSISDLVEVRQALTEALSAAGVGEVVDFEVASRGLTIAIATDDVLFASGSAEFGVRGREIIAVIAPTLTQFTNEILVEGHTDTVPIDRIGYDNWNLSADRALAVLKLLVTAHGITPSRLAASGYGEHRPKASNETTEGKATNRRVELVIVTERGDSNDR